MPEVEDGCGAMDFLSQLPDDILAHILSFLRLEEAVRAKLLSPRWRHLYPESSCLRFSPSAWDRGALARCAELRDQPVMFAAFVDKVMQQFRAQKIKEFKVVNQKNWIDYELLLDEWIRLACLMKTDIIDLVFPYLHKSKTYAFPFHFLNAVGAFKLKELRLSVCALTQLCTLTGPITSLIILRLFRVSVTTFDGIAYYFPNLEELSLKFCEQLTSMQQLLALCRRLSYLKSLTVSTFGGPEFFQIHNANRTNFTSVGGVKELSFKGLSGLQELRIDADFSGQCAVTFLSTLPQEIPHLVRLSMRSTDREEFLFPCFTSRFKCLEFWELAINITPDTDLRNLLKSLEVAPLLQELRITLSGEAEQSSDAWLEEQLMPQHVNKMQDASEMHYIHPHLKKLRIESSNFGKSVALLIITLLRQASSLEDLYLIDSEDETADVDLKEMLAPHFPRVRITTSVD